MRTGWGRVKSFPYGELATAPTTSGEKFATYWRDAGTGLDYAVNRYYSSQMGRFVSADPYQASGGAANPGSWNRYAYVQGDPVNFHDPAGLQLRAPICYDSSVAIGPHGFYFSNTTVTTCDTWYWGGGVQADIGGGEGVFRRQTALASDPNWIRTKETVPGLGVGYRCHCCRSGCWSTETRGGSRTSLPLHTCRSRGLLRTQAFASAAKVRERSYRLRPPGGSALTGSDILEHNYVISGSLVPHGSTERRRV
ncbi:MAG: RHS repeat-associated core domain-containing protein [Bryobacterales bacterium]|nr:RHS repeat-associated core domain-containing protein [Bryobacterales bacterium]